MKAAILRGPQPLEIAEVDINGPEVGEVLLRVKACGVCHSDYGVVENAREPLLQPVILGHEAAGVVEAVGDGVTSVAPGDHVLTAFHPTCGRCFYCVTGMPNLCERPDNPDRSAGGPRPRLTLGGQPLRQGVGVGGFAEYVIMPEGGVVALRRDAPLETVCLVACCVTTGISAVTTTAGVRAGSDVAVIGLGGVGLSIVQGARLVGARRVIAVDLLDSKLSLAGQFGATHTVNAANQDPVQAVRELTSNRLDYAFDATGVPQAVEQAFAMIRPGGTAVAVGITRGTVSLPGREFLQEKKLIGSLYGSASIRVDIPRIVDLYMDGRVMLDQMVSRRRPLEEINEAFADMKAGAVVRTVIEF